MAPGPSPRQTSPLLRSLTSQGSNGGILQNWRLLWERAEALEEPRARPPSAALEFARGARAEQHPPPCAYALVYLETAAPEASAL